MCEVKGATRTLEGSGVPLYSKQKLWNLYPGFNLAVSHKKTILLRIFVPLGIFSDSYFEPVLIAEHTTETIYFIVLIVQ